MNALPMTVQTAIKVGLSPTRYYAEQLYAAYDQLSDLPDSQITREVLAAKGNLETILRRIADRQLSGK
jgi:hypothetical protein